MAVPPIVLNRTFKHTNWVDSIDRVRAGGGNGFNVRFNALETDLDQLSQVIATIGGQLGATPVAAPVTLTLTPTLVTIGNDNTNTNEWAHGAGFAQKANNSSFASGMMSVTLPDKVVIQSLRATGNTSLAITTGLLITLSCFNVKDPVTPGATVATELLAINVTSAGAYDLKTATPASAAANLKVDAANFRYFITAQIQPGGGVSNASIVTINTFQIVYQ